jgi:hypothetical protein
MRVLSFAICLLAMLAGGCASTDTVKEARGQGVTRVYKYPYEPVFDATVAAAKSKELEIVESNKITGQVVLSHGVTLLSWGERIAVFIRIVSPTATEVEIVSKPVVSTLNFPPNWQQILFDQIDVELRARK